MEFPMTRHRVRWVSKLLGIVRQLDATNLVAVLQHAESLLDKQFDSAAERFPTPGSNLHAYNLADVARHVKPMWVHHP